MEETGDDDTRPAEDPTAQTPGDQAEGATTDAADAEGAVTYDEPAGPPRRPVVPVDLRDYADFEPDEARRVRVATTDQLALELWCLEPQQSTPVLAYEDADVTYTVLGGRSWFVTDQGEIGLDPMGALLVPSGVVHGIDNRGPDPLIVVAGMAPPDRRGIDQPVSDEARAIRDDQESGVLATLRRALTRLFGEE